MNSGDVLGQLGVPHRTRSRKDFRVIPQSAVLPPQCSQFLAFAGQAVAFTGVDLGLTDSVRERSR